MAQQLIQKNIVLIAETGAGKSSFINNVALMLRFPNFKEAIQGAGDFVPPIPVRTRLNNVLIVDGQDDDNERSDQASFRTLMPQIYRIRCGNFELNIMDTPGMSDSEERNLDEEHVQNITACFGQLEDIHGILVLLKSTENTVNDSLKNTLNMVLSCLGKTAGKMISFGITYSGYNKNAGTAPDVIRKFFTDLRNNPGIDYSRDNLYCFESMPLFQVLSTKKPLFHVLSSKTRLPTNAKNRQVNPWTYENNFAELHKYLSMVYQRNDSYKVMNIPALILAKQIQPAFARLLPHLDTKDEEIKSDLERLKKEWSTKNLEYAQQQSKLKQIRQWREEYKVTKTRVVYESRLETRQLTVDEEYVDTVCDVEEYVELGEIRAVSMVTGAVGGCLAGMEIGGTVAGMAIGGPVGALLGGINGLAVGLLGGYKSAEKKYRKVQKEVPKTRQKLQEYQVEVSVPVTEEYQETEYRDEVAIEEDPEVKEILDKIEMERNEIENNMLQNSSLYQNFQAEKKMVSSLLCDLTSYLEEHAIVAFGDSGLESSASSEIANWIHKLKISGQWKPNSVNIGAADLIARLTAMQDSQYFGNEITKILSQCKNLENVPTRVVNIPVKPNSVFIERLIHDIQQ